MRRKTSRVRKRKNQRQLQLQVRSPRIVGFEVLRGAARLGRWALVLLAAAAVVWGARTGLKHAFIDNPEFRLQEIKLDTNGRLTLQDFAEVTEIDPGASIFAVQMRATCEKLRARPGILTAEVSRRLPGTLKVKVRERIPVAWVECRRLGIIGRDPATGILVDREGVCFPCEKWWEEEGRALPVVVVQAAGERDFAIGKKLRHREAERGLALVLRSAHHLAGLQWSLPVVGVKNDFSLVAATNEGAVVTFGMYEHDRQLRDLVAILEHAAKSDRELATANLIPERNVPVTFAEDGIIEPVSPRGIPEDRLERDIRAILNRG